MKKRIAVLISGNGSNLQALIDAAQHPHYPAEIVLVISNKPDAYGLKRAENAGIHTQIISHKEYAERETYDKALDKALKDHTIEVVCLAGFMRLLTPWLVEQWENRMLNIHPSLLPAFKGMHAVGQALAAGARKSGCTVHIVTAEMDAGPIIMQAEVRISPNDTADTLTERIHTAEHTLYPTALKAFLQKMA